MLSVSIISKQVFKIVEVLKNVKNANLTLFVFAKKLFPLAFCIKLKIIINV